MQQCAATGGFSADSDRGAGHAVLLQGIEDRLCSGQAEGERGGLRLWIAGRRVAIACDGDRAIAALGGEGLYLVGRWLGQAGSTLQEYDRGRLTGRRLWHWRWRDRHNRWGAGRGRSIRRRGWQRWLSTRVQWCRG